MSQQGSAENAPGVLSGNVIEVPIHIPHNLCGNMINIIGVLDPMTDNICVNPSEMRASSTLSIPIGASAESAESANTRTVDVVLARNADGQVIGAALPLNTPGFDLTQVRHWETSQATLTHSVLQGLQDD